MRKKKERSLVKVIFEYDNEEAEYLDGKDLEKWKRASSGTALLSWVHGGKTGFEGIRWKKVKK